MPDWCGSEFDSHTPRTEMRGDKKVPLANKTGKISNFYSFLNWVVRWQTFGVSYKPCAKNNMA